MQTRILAIALCLLGLCFVGFAWWVYFSSGGQVHWGIPTLATAFPLVVTLLVVLIPRLSARQGAANLERALSNEAMREQRSNSARAPEIERLRNEFERAVGALKNSRLAKGQGSSRDALYRLPWYTIIGPPASGKTTVLRNSGLKFPHLTGTGDRLKGVGGTRNCDWWLTNHAVLLDTAGRWTLEEDDRGEWLAFLDLLKRHRGKQPLNGVIAAISIAGDEETSLAGVDIEGVKMLAGRVRERLDEITGRLGVALPVYLMFTKCDLISGFVETFGEMTPADRRQIWGFTAPLLRNDSVSAGTFFSDQFKTLQASVERYALSRMAQEVRPDVTSRIFEFPAQFAAIEDKLTAFVDELFEESAYGESPILRGAYFTSGTQEGSPADFLLSDIGRALNIRAPTDESTGEKKSYFLHDMLMRVVFEDRSLASASQEEMRRQAKQQRVWTSGLFGFATLVACLPTLSCHNNLESLERTRTTLTQSQEDVGLEGNSTTPHKVDRLLELQAEAARYEGGLPSVAFSFGLYQGDDIKTPLLRYYDVALREWLVRPLLNRNNERLITITQQLEALRAEGSPTRLGEKEQQELLDALQLHLLLTTPREDCIPKALARKDWILGRTQDLWQQAQEGDKDEQAKRRQLLTRYIERFAVAPEDLALSKDRRHVELARAALGSDDKVAQLLNGLMPRFAKDDRDLNSLVGATTTLEGRNKLPGAFTADAWRQTTRDVNSTRLWNTSDENWVLGCGASDAQQLTAAQRSSEFQIEFLKRYEEAWRQFLSGITSRTPSNATEAEIMLSEMVGRPGALGTLFQRVKENTELPPAPVEESAVDQVQGALADKLPAGVADKAKQLTHGPKQRSAQAANDAVERLKRNFAEFTGFGVSGPEGLEVPLEAYRKQIEPVLSALKAYRNDETQLPALTTAVGTALENVELLLSRFPSTWNPIFRELLVPPLSGVAAMGQRDRGEQVQKLWCQMVYRPYQEELAGRFPLQTDANTPATLQAFARFFQPGSGTLWAFQSSQLGSSVVLEGDRFRFATQGGGSARALFREELVTFLNRANDVKAAFFPANGAAVRMPFRVRVRGAAGYSVTTFSFSGKNVRYDAGTESWVNMEWPGDQPSLGASLTATPYQGPAPRPLSLEGEWGLFMLLDPRLGHGQILERSDRQFTAGWKPKGSQNWIKIDFATDDGRSPLLSVPFGSGPRSVLPLAIPARITHAGGGC
ncbi:MAG: type VI secretion system membrane subunit TssM [Myxococcales bacterium]